MPCELNLTTKQLDQILKNFGSPVYIYDAQQIIYNANQFMKTFRTYFPEFKQYFAVKALPNEEILNILSTCGMGFDCSSPVELVMATKFVSPDNIIYTSNFTSVEDLAFALKQKVIINLDDIDGLENLKMTGYPLPELICFRLNPNIGKTDSETKSNILGGCDSKFGIVNIIEAYELAQTMEFKRFAIHVMTGSCVMNISYWKELTDIVFSYINEIYLKLGITMEFIDLGGGIGIPYRPTDEKVNIEELAKLIFDTFNENIKKYSLPFSPNLVMENGRYITGPYGWLISRCKSIKSVYIKTDEPFKEVRKKFYGLDACMANLMRPGMYGSYHHITIPRLRDEKRLEEAHVVGTLCENNDWFAKNRLLPVGIKKEDIFVIHDTGAHGHCMGFNYNGKLRSAELLLEIDTVRLIRYRETMESFLHSQHILTPSIYSVDGTTMSSTIYKS